MSANANATNIMCSRGRPQRLAQERIFQNAAAGFFLSSCINQSARTTSFASFPKRETCRYGFSKKKASRNTISFFFAVLEIRSILSRNHISVVLCFFCNCFEIVQALHPYTRMGSIQHSSFCESRCGYLIVLISFSKNSFCCCCCCCCYAVVVVVVVVVLCLRHN